MKALNDLEKIDAVKAVTERVNLFKITTAAMIKACEEFVILTAEVRTVLFWKEMLSRECQISGTEIEFGFF